MVGSHYNIKGKEIIPDIIVLDLNMPKINGMSF
jgi:DNA-binding response OmpR family regulator